MIEQIPTNNGIVSTRRHSCLMGCKNGCNVIIQDNDKLSYALGNFTPDVESATALVNYAKLHAESSNGQVPYKSWPDKIKGHFVARIPPLRKD
jgi:predicted metal-binding protein